MFRATKFTGQPPDQAGLTEVPDAVLTVFAHDRIPVVRRKPDRFVSGAVYDADGRLVRASQRVGGWLGDHAVTADPSRLPPWNEPVVELSGTWLYGGTWFCHFGHFITETVTTLWPEAGLDRVVAHPFWFGRAKDPYQLEALTLLGIPRPPALVGGQRVRVERLLVPDRTFVPNAYAMPEAVGVWERIRAAATGAGPTTQRAELVFLSRSALPAKAVRPGAPSRSLANDAAVDELAADLGFLVVHPQTLSFTEQVDLVAHARVLAGPGGSALHLSAFAPESTVVLELADGRGRDRPVLTQELVCHAVGQRLGFVPLTGQGDETGWRHDVGRLRQELTALLEAV